MKALRSSLAKDEKELTKLLDAAEATQED